jgi:hypothetical protein
MTFTFLAQNLQLFLAKCFRRELPRKLNRDSYVARPLGELIVTQPSKNETTVQQNSPDVREGRMSLAAYLAAGIGLAGIASTADAAIVNINITDTRGDGNATTDDDISGVNGGLNAGAQKNILNWLGPSVTTSSLQLLNQIYLGTRTDYFYHGIANGTGGTTVMEFALQQFNSASPRNFAAGATVDSTATWNAVRSRTVFEYDYSFSSGGISPNFTAGSYMGFRFGSGGNLNYGWLEVTWDSTGNGQWQILSGAYESTINTGIVIPSANVPAPSPASLLALIVGGAALRQWRAGRRKQLLLEQTAA